MFEGCVPIGLRNVNDIICSFSQADELVCLLEAFLELCAERLTQTGTGSISRPHFKSRRHGQMLKQWKQKTSKVCAVRPLGDSGEVLITVPGHAGRQGCIVQ